MVPKILLIDDEESICNLVRLHFQTEGYLVYTALDTEEATQALSHNPDLILLDINMPETDGLEFCRNIRNHIDCPILFLTSRVTEQDRITGLQAGGDDYITKPFSLAELTARVEAHLRREPLTALKQGISHIADNDLDFTIDYGKQDELGELCRAFETMRGELVKNNRYMWGLVDERKRINASIAHDLRTPITVIKGYSEYLDRNAGKETLTGDGTREIAGYINQAAARLEEYADSVREVQALEDMHLEYSEVLLESFLEELRAQLSVIARQNRKEICLRAELPEQTVLLSTATVFRIMENIVDNSLRFCRERIDAEVSFAAPFLTITITDDGRGFLEKECVEATDYFYKGKSEKKHFGIGLTICRILAQKHGGDILLDNVPEGGARVAVKIKTEEISPL